MTSGYRSILFPDGAPRVDPEQPAYFADLNLDQVVNAITAGRERYELAPFFELRLRNADAVRYRHEVFRDLQDGEVLGHVRSFATRMREMREHFGRVESTRYRYASQAWFLDGARSYCEAVRGLADDLSDETLGSRGLRAFREHVARYAASEEFSRLSGDVDRVREALGVVRYTLNIRGNRVKVGRFEGEDDFGAEVVRTFERFRQGDVKDYTSRVRISPEMDHVEGQVLGLVAKLHPREFGALEEFCERHRDFVDETISAFDREVQFYVAYLEFIERLSRAGLPFCLPEISDASKEIGARETFDIALADKLVGEQAEVVTNDFHLADPERIIVVSGPNQGGKTTFARTFGQLHPLAALGCPVPGRKARLFLCDQLFTHFEREEEVTSLSGKLEDDLLRIHAILDRATSDSVVVMNESFTSTTLQDALLLGTAVMEQMIERGLLCVYVTFVDELASLSDTTVSMVSTVVPDDPATRTYKLERRPADGLAYAESLAEKYGLSYRRLRERIAA